MRLREQSVQTFDGLRLEEVVPLCLNTWRLQRMGKCTRQVLQDDPATNFGKSGLEQCTVVSNVSTDVDEHRQLRVPALSFALNWILIQPPASHRLLHAHILDESSSVLWVLGEPRICVQVRLVRRLKDGNFAVGDILVLIVAQEGGHFLEQRRAVLKAGRLVIFR